MTKFRDRLEKDFRLAVNNVVHFGDTDIFPFPVENHVLHDKPDELIPLLMDTFDNFDQYFHQNPPRHIQALSSVGYSGFRWASQLDPFWNCYLLGLVLSISKEIESYRIPTREKKVFSYRIKTNRRVFSIFNKDVSYVDFLEQSRTAASKHKFVLSCDIADCYQRIYHHRLENALEQCTDNSDVTKQIRKIIQHYSQTKSYGLPIGGPAARILCELVLNFSDNLLKSNSIPFCRFADDYNIFCDSRDDAYGKLVYISEKLLRNDGLALQKSKTRISSKDEYLASHPLAPVEEENISEERAILRVSLKFDPYSKNAEEEYEELRKEVEKFDIIDLLNSELKKAKVHSTVTKKLIQAVKFLSDDVIDKAILTLFDNLDVLYPIFPTVCIVTKDLCSRISDDAKRKIIEKIIDGIDRNTHIYMIDINFCYALRLLYQAGADDIDDLLVKKFDTTTNPLIRKDIILFMANRRKFYWLTDLMNDYSSLGPWEQRAFLVASYFIGDAGKHWRDHIKFSPFPSIVRDWVSSKPLQKGWKVPL